MVGHPTGITRRGVKRKWSDDEKQVFDSLFRNHIRQKKAAPAFLLQRASELLSNRTVATIRTRLDNIIKGKTKAISKWMLLGNSLYSVEQIGGNITHSVNKAWKCTARPPYSIWKWPTCRILQMTFAPRLRYWLILFQQYTVSDP